MKGTNWLFRRDNQRVFGAEEAVSLAAASRKRTGLAAYHQLRSTIVLWKAPAEVIDRLGGVNADQLGICSNPRARVKCRTAIGEIVPLHVLPQIDTHVRLTRDFFE